MSKPAPVIPKKEGQFIKPTAMIHVDVAGLEDIHHRTVNILLNHAKLKMHLQADHAISYKEFCAQLGWTVKASLNKETKATLERVQSIQVKWNILQKDKKLEWGVMSLISYLRFRKGVIEFGFPKPLIEFYTNPHLYVVLDLGVLVALGTQGATQLYEIICDDIKFKRTEEGIIETSEFDLLNLRKNLGGSGSYYDQYKRFNERILNPSIKKINEVNKQFTIAPQLIKRQRKVVAVKFIVTQVQEAQLSLDVPPDPLEFAKQNLRDILIRDCRHTLDSATALVKEYVEDLAYLKNSIDYVLSQENIKNIPAYLRKCLDEKWIEHLPEDEVVVKGEATLQAAENHALNEYVEKNGLQAIRTQIVKYMTSYEGKLFVKNWLEPMRIKSKEDGVVVLLLPSRAKVQYLENTKKSAFIRAFDDLFEERVLVEFEVYDE